jgi:hypothetical protein
VGGPCDLGKYLSLKANTKQKLLSRGPKPLPSMVTQTKDETTLGPSSADVEASTKDCDIGVLDVAHIEWPSDLQTQ